VTSDLPAVFPLLLIPLFLSFGCAPKSPALSADGVPIAFRVQGDGEPVLVFVHGWCCDKSYWEAQAAHFSKKHKVVAIDLAGHGESGLGRETWTIAAFGEDVVAVADKLGLERMVLIGHSMGGPVVLEAAKRMPGRVIGLVGADTFKIIEPEFTREQANEWLTSFRADFVGTTDRHVRSMFPPGADSVLVEKIVADMCAAPQQVGLGALEASLDFLFNDLPGALQETGPPIRCINSNMYSTDLETARRYASSFEVSFMSGVGHFVMNEDPETFNRLLEEAVAELVRLEGSQ